MKIAGILILASILQLSQPAKDSLVKLVNNGYEDIVFAINPKIPENPKLIENIKKMVADGSTYLLQATENRLYFKSVKILIPSTWTTNSTYSRPKTESYDKADIIIADPFVKGDFPYTLQYGGCGEPGKYIHLTPNFIQNDRVLRIYGPRGRVLVHEWAHLRWGVFDEYNNDIPWYLSKQGKSEATRETNVHAFCKEDTHNKEAPNEQNRLCNHQSVWDVIMKSPDMKSAPLENTNIPAPTFTLLQYKDRVVTLVLDVSGSMGGVNKGFDGSTYGTEIVLLTDGEDSGISSCFIDVQNSGAVIHTLALGNQADKALEELASMTGGLKLYSSDRVDANGLIDSFSGIKSSSGDIQAQSIQIESTATTIEPNQCLTGKVTMDNSVGNETFFLVTWNLLNPSIQLTDPSGKIYENAQFVSDAASKSARLAVPGTAQPGDWPYKICNTQSSAQVLGITVNSRAADPNVPPITVEPFLNADTNSFPTPMVVYATVTQGVAPVLGVNVIAYIEAQDGTSTPLPLLDNGAGADIIKNDGIYTRYFTGYKQNGRYNLKVRVENYGKDSKAGIAKSRALYLPGYVENGTLISNPPKPKNTFENQNVGNFSRTSSGGAFVITNVPSGPIPDTYSPSKITDLNAIIEGQIVKLSWTATGDDLDKGNGMIFLK
ncbi:hypothetical protein AB205_0152790 [Aquarana catesbeiana]|uniref:Calcium-activated chloride channel N-terminal domain-containing protein n=1 Tax=Aquarana catesbeiana TaxID=8400 RepID=A0A2G9RMZ5_AQUCT|nr:hypothetical protein AB205_0152790 [Aquarana catesbeiana]